MPVFPRELKPAPAPTQTRRVRVHSAIKAGDRDIAVCKS